MNRTQNYSQKRRTEERRSLLHDSVHRFSKPYKCGCTHKICVTWANSKQRKTDFWVKISQVQGFHSHGCRPTMQQLLQHHQKSGSFSIYSKTSTSHDVNSYKRTKALNNLFNMMRYDDHVSSKTMRNILKEAYPKAVPIDAPLITNIRARAKKVLSKQDNGNDPLLGFAGITTEDATSLLNNAEEDVHEGKMCGIDLNNPRYFVLHTK